MAGVRVRAETRKGELKIREWFAQRQNVLLDAATNSLLDGEEVVCEKPFTLQFTVKFNHKARRTLKLMKKTFTSYAEQIVEKIRREFFLRGLDEEDYTLEVYEDEL